MPTPYPVPGDIQLPKRFAQKRDEAKSAIKGEARRGIDTFPCSIDNPVEFRLNGRLLIGYGSLVEKKKGICYFVMGRKGLRKIKTIEDIKQIKSMMVVITNRPDKGMRRSVRSEFFMVPSVFGARPLMLGIVRRKICLTHNSSFSVMVL